MMQKNYRCELYIRTDTIGRFDVQQRVLDRIKSLEERGVFDRAGIEATWDGIEIPEVGARDEILETYEEFRDWARANDFSLKPSFDTRPRYIPGTTEKRDAVILPVVALAIYSEDELQAVVPSSDEFDHYTVQEALEGFERGDVDRWMSRFTGVTVDRTSPRLDPTVSV